MQCKRHFLYLKVHFTVTRHTIVDSTQTFGTGIDILFALKSQRVIVSKDMHFEELRGEMGRAKNNWWGYLPPFPPR